MRIDKIELCNLGPLEGEHEIDFSKEPLRSAGLFAITGHSGTGKTTWLDAICLALYGRTPAYDIKSNPNDLRNILHKGQTEAYAFAVLAFRRQLV